MAGILFCGPSRTKGAKCSLGVGENPYFKFVGAVVLARRGVGTEWRWRGVAMAWISNGIELCGVSGVAAARYAPTLVNWH